MQKILREPLVHFLFLGACLFWVFNLLNPQSVQNLKTIQVDNDKLLTFLQYRAKQFDVSQFSDFLETLSADKLQRLVNDYTKEEALFREAKSLGLDSNDYVARQRLIQQVTYLIRSFIDAGVSLSEADIQRYYNDNSNRYRELGKITFTHVYFSFDKQGQAQALAQARETLSKLNQQQVPFHKGLSYGDRFLYHANYVQKEADLVASHFGSTMQTTLFSLSANDRHWQGPYVSAYGAHLVMVTSRSEDSQPPLIEVRDQVEQDALQAERQQQLDTAIASIVDNYQLTLAEPLRTQLNDKDS